MTDADNILFVSGTGNDIATFTNPGNWTLDNANYSAYGQTWRQYSYAGATVNIEQELLNAVPI